MKKYILNLLTFGLYNRVDLMSQALIDAVAKQNLRNQQLQNSIDDIEQPDFDDSVISAVDSYLTNNFCPSDWELIDEGEIDYRIEQAIDNLRDELESDKE